MKIKKTRGVNKAICCFFSPSPSFPSLSRAAYYSVLIYKALNVILHVEVKGRDWKRKREKKRGREGGRKEKERGEKKERNTKMKGKRRLETDRDRKSAHDMGKWQQGIFRAAVEHKRVIVLAQMLHSHNKQDTMFLLSWWAQSVKWLKIDFVPVITVCKLLSRDCKGSDFLITYILWCLMIGFLK